MNYNPLFTDLSSTRQLIASLAQRVGDAGDKEGKARLETLNDVLDPKSTARATWANIDIYQIIHPDAIAERYRLGKTKAVGGPGRVARFFEVIRDILIFLPIFFTWFGISQATTQYNNLIQDRTHPKPGDLDLIGQPFLYQWQQAFNHRLDSSLILSNIALTDVMLIAIIIVLTLFIHFMSRDTNTRLEQETQDLHAKLLHAISSATLLINYRPPHLLTPNAGPTDQLDQAAQHIYAIANQTAQALDKLSNDMMSRFDKTLGHITQRIGQVASELTDQLQNSSRYLAQLTSSVNSVQTLAQELKTAAQTLTTGNRELKESIQQLLKPATELSQQQQNLLQAVNQGVGQLQGNAQQLQVNADTLKTITQKQDDWIGQMNNALDSINQTMKKADEMVTQQADFIQQQSGFVTQLGNERSEQAKLANNMLQVMMAMDGALKSVQDVGNSLRRISADSNDLLRLYAALPDSLKANMGDIMRNYINAAQTLDKSGRELNNSAFAIATASQQMENVIHKLDDHLTQSRI